MLISHLSREENLVGSVLNGIERTPPGLSITLSVRHTLKHTGTAPTHTHLDTHTSTCTPIDTQTRMLAQNIQMHTHWHRHTHSTNTHTNTTLKAVSLISRFWAAKTPGQPASLTPSLILS